LTPLPAGTAPTVSPPVRRRGRFWRSQYEPPKAQGKRFDDVMLPVHRGHTLRSRHLLVSGFSITKNTVSLLRRRQCRTYLLSR
jgi:hypothetical protein